MAAEAALERVTVDGRTVAYRRAGAGAPLVLLHGGWSDSRAWGPQLAALSSDFDVIAWDTPGCGGSDEPPDGVTLGELADAVAGLVTALGVRPVHLCGLSFGGGLALAVYQRHPELIRSLVLADAYAGWGVHCRRPRSRPGCNGHRPSSPAHPGTGGTATCPASLPARRRRTRSRSSRR